MFIYIHTLRLSNISLYIYIMKYYSAIRKNEIMLFAATWMGLEIIILREVSQRKTNI